MDRGRHEEHFHYRSLSRNIFLTVVLVACLPMLLVGCFILYQFKASYHEKIEAHLQELVLKHKQNIDTFLKEKLADIRVLGKTFSYDELSNDSFLQDQLERLQQSFGGVFVDLGVINARGLQVAYAGPFKLGKALYSKSDWFKEAMEREIVISDVFLGLRGLPHFIVAVRDNHEGEPWILRSTIDFVAFNNLVEHIRIGETGFAFILNRKGEFQTKPLMDIIPSRPPYVDFLHKQWHKGDSVRILERGDDSGENNIYVSATLKSGDWLLIYQQKASDAFHDFHGAFRVVVAIMILGGLGIVTTASLLSNRMANRLARSDKEKEMMDEQIVETGKLASLGELAAGIAHEINNPVAIMVEEAGWIEDLLEEEEFQAGQNLDEFSRALKQIRTQGKRCKAITYKLLSFARKTDSRIQEVNINELLEDLVALSGQRAKYANVSIVKDFQEDLPTLQVSQSELQQVFLNLINNALDAMEKSGGNLGIQSRLAGEFVAVEVVDNGPGIPEPNLNRIFDPFFTTKPVGKGTGLGLSICYGIIKKMGGDIEVQSAVGSGSVFRVTLPGPGKQGLRNGRSAAGKEKDLLKRAL